MRFVISKSSRMPGKVSYTGPAWDDFRHLRKDVYEDRAEAEEHARMLGEVNAVGFDVTELAD
jgi:hypothetical protein